MMNYNNIKLTMKRRVLKHLIVSNRNEAHVQFSISQLQCILAYHWSFVLYDVIFIRHYELLQGVVTAISFIEKLLKNMKVMIFKLSCNIKVKVGMFRWNFFLVLQTMDYGTNEIISLLVMKFIF